MNRFIIKFLFVVLFKLDVCFNLLNKPCSQPRGDICIGIKECPFFINLQTNSNIPRNHRIQLIREHHCGFDRNVPKVCCTLPKVTTTEDPLQEKFIEPPDVSKHPNLNLLLRDDCGPLSNEDRITIGSASTLMEFPWMALLAYMTNDGLEFRCAGTVINERYILTAAHCIKNMMTYMTLLSVRLGEHNLSTDEDCDEITGQCAPPVQNLFVEDVYIHPKYDPYTFRNDIALVQLETPANFSNTNVQPICLPLTDLKLDGESVIISGWGETETGLKSDMLLKTPIPVVPHSECRLIYDKYTPITSKQICAGGFKGGDSCRGDSGGPLMKVGFVDGRRRYIQHGIISYGPRVCGTEGHPSVYTRISYYLDWILDNMKV